jgi:pyruvate kinase
MAARIQPTVVERLYGGVRELLEAATQLEREMQEDIDRVPADQRASARNLLHYLAVRRHDIRALQLELGQLGLSSLGRLEAHVAAGLESVLLALARMSDRPLPPVVMRARPTFFREGDERLSRHTEALLGPPRSADYTVRIMVTLPTEAATDYALVCRLVAAGMNVARINTAHDSPSQWEEMAANVRAAAAEQRRGVRVLLDLAGPKLRTGAIVPGPEIVHVKPKRDERGVVVEPAMLRLCSSYSAGSSAEGLTNLPVSDDVVASARVGDQILLRDAPGRRRQLVLSARDESGVIARAERSIWFESELPITLVRDGATVCAGCIGRLPARPASIGLREGDALIVTAEQTPGSPATRDEHGHVLDPARIPCTLPDILREVRAGERISFDDGKIGGVIEEASERALRVRITRTAPGGAKLRSDKGINFPDSTLKLPSLTSSDMAAVDSAAAFADIVGLSFVRTAADVEALHEALAARNADTVGVVLKIETRRGFENLPQILLTALRRPPAGVMVARGDLGVEIGFERMAEVQEQILWLCEAAHLPVIWATQVLEGLTKTGMPTRGEVTDAAMSSRAECVMLNKGPYIEKAVRFLDDVLTRMRDHNIKKTPMLRRLKVSEGRWDAAAKSTPAGTVPSSPD